MNHDNIKPQSNKNICNGFGCHSEATNNIKEEIDGISMIALDLCDDCVAKFREY